MYLFDNQNIIIGLIILALLYFTMKKDEKFGCATNQVFCGGACQSAPCKCKNNKCVRK